MNFAVLMIDNDTQRVASVEICDYMEQVNDFLKENERENKMYDLHDVYSFQVKRLEDVEVE